MAWHTLGETKPGDRLVGIDWDGPEFAQVRLDPYLIWLDMVGNDTIGKDRFAAEYGGALSVLVELKRPFVQPLAGIAIPKVYQTPLGRGEAARFVSARVAPDKLRQLLLSGDVERVQLELAKVPGTDAADGDVAAVPPVRDNFRPETWIGVIDVGCAFAHGQYRITPASGDHDTSRVRYLWDQGLADRPTPWRQVHGLGYGVELGPHEIDAAMCGLPDERGCYESAAMPELVDGRVQHGYGVMDLAAGGSSPLVTGPPPLGTPAACMQPIVFVQLESIERRDTSISSLGVAVLDGLRWMIDRVERHHYPAPSDPGRDPATRLVVNISYGGLAGPHDGTSVLEAAIDELVEQRDNLVVVLSAGNSYDEELKVHGELDVSHDHPGELHWEIQQDDRTDSFLEIWFDGDADAPVLDEIEIVVRPPSGPPQAIKVDSSRVLPGDGSGRPIAGAFFRRHVANGDNSAMCLVAIGPTVGDGNCAPAGTWTVTIVNHSNTVVHLHAWIERDDYVAGNLNRRQQSWLADPGNGTVTSTYGLSSMAHGKHTVVVGGYCLSDGMAAVDTASGPSRGNDARDGPDLSAPSDENRALRGVLVAGSTTGVVNRLSGTSAAAPSVTRLLADRCLVQTGDVSIEQVRQWLKGNDWTPAPENDQRRTGPVSLDLDQLLANPEGKLWPTSMAAASHRQRVRPNGRSPIRTMRCELR